MAHEQHHSHGQEGLSSVIAAYFQAVDAGNKLDPQQWIEQHPKLADELRDFFATQGQAEKKGQLSRDPSGDGLGVTTDDRDRLENCELSEIARSFGDYEIEGEIARGGMGIVYRARQVSLNRPVAIKMIRAGHLADETDVRRFREEAEAAARLDHPNIVPIYEVGEHKGQHFFSMKLIEGEHLASQQKQYPKNVKAAAQLMITVAEAIHHAHQRGIIHRDLKPENVLIDQNGVPAVSDFGVAKRMDRQEGVTERGAIVGTLEYLSPEQARADPSLTISVDVYGLSSILYFLLTGRAPFQADNPFDVLQQVLNVDPVSPRLMNPGVSRDLETICLKGLSKHPSTRYDTAQELAEEFRRYVEGRPIEARPISVWERGLRWGQRRPAITVLGLLLALLILIGGPLITVKWIQAERNARQERDQRQRAERLFYSAEIRLSHHLWKLGDLEGANEELRRTPQDLRHWEYGYLRRLYDPNTLIKHSGAVECVVFSPDGKLIASGSSRGAVRICDSRTGKRLPSLDRRNWSVRCLSFSPDGKRIATGGGFSNQPESLWVWDVRSGQKLLKLSGHASPICSLAFSRDGKSIVSGGGFPAGSHGEAFGEIRVWNLKTKRCILHLEQPGTVVRSVMFSADGKRIFSGDSKSDEVKMWDVQSGQQLLALKGTSACAQSLAITADGSRITAAFKHVVIVWNANNAQRLFRVRSGAAAFTCAACSSDGRLIVSGGLDCLVQVWDTSNRRLQFSLKGHTHPVRSVAVSPDGKRIVSGGSDGTVRVWHLRPNQARFTLGRHSTSVCSLAFSSDGARIVTASEDGWRVSGDVRVWDLKRRKVLVTWRGHENGTNHVAFSPDGTRVVSGGNDKRVKVWDTEKGKLLLDLQGHKTAVRSVAFSPGGEVIASTGIGTFSQHGEVKVWDARTGNVIFSTPQLPGSINCVAFSPNGERVATGDGSGVSVWNVKTGEKAFVLNELAGTVHSTVFSPDGKRIAAGGGRVGTGNGTLMMWDAENGEELIEFKGLIGPLRSVAFSPDGQRIVTGCVQYNSKGGGVQVWDATNGRELLSLLTQPQSVRSVAFSPNGKQIAASIGLGVVVWDSTSGFLH